MHLGGSFSEISVQLVPLRGIVQNLPSTEQLRDFQRAVQAVRDSRNATRVLSLREPTTFRALESCRVFRLRRALAAILKPRLFFWFFIS